MVNVSVIIVNYNTLQMTQECIDSIYDKTSGIEFEIILIDNASQDGSKEHFEKEENLGRIKYVYSYENMGFGRANNVGMMLSKGKYLFLLNSDTVLINNAIKLFYDYAENAGVESFYGCWLEDNFGNFVHSAAEFPSAGKILRKLILSYFHKMNSNINIFFDNIMYNSSECTEVGYVTGADMFFSRNIYERTGGFDHNYFMYYEESDWQHSSFLQGYRSCIISKPRIIHLEGGSASIPLNTSKISKVNQFSKRARFMLSEITYVRKFTPIIPYAFFRIFYFILNLPIITFSSRFSRKDFLPCLRVLIFGR